MIRDEPESLAKTPLPLSSLSPPHASSVVQGPPQDLTHAKQINISPHSVTAFIDEKTGLREVDVQGHREGNEGLSGA